MPVGLAVKPDQFATFGELLRFLRHRAGLTQLELSIAVGYSESQISRLEKDERAPDKAVLAARFVPALYLHNEPDWTARLMEMAAASHAERAVKGLGTPPKAPAYSLPIQLTSFIGREREIAEVKRLLSVCRLLTLTGAGGCGKTRLALRVIADLMESHNHGVWFIELAALGDPLLVPQAVAAGLDVREQPGHSILDTLVEHLRSKNNLIVLDNCEHLIEACARLANTLLRACPSLTILVTSREALGIAGETAWTVPSLSLPDVRHQHLTFAALLQYEAVQLFTERAAAAQPSFKLNERDALTVAQVCRRLDGIPLAIELAAARVKVLKTEEIAARLADRFDLLTVGSRTALPRHQTLRAAIDWSYDLLTESERVLLRRLSVFASGCTLGVAEAVCSMQGAESSNDVELPPAFRLLPSEILDILSHLVDKSLLLVDTQGGETRYYMLDTIRQYASEKLVESREDKTLRDRHLEFFVQMAEEGAVKMRSGERPGWTNRLELEQDNLRAAMEWSLARDVAQGFRVVGAMLRFWLVRGCFTEGRDWSNRMLAHSNNVPAALKTRALNTAGALAYFQHDSTAHALLEESVELSEEIGDKQLLADALGWLAGIFDLRGDLDKAASLCEKAIALYRVTGDDWDLADQLHGYSWQMMRRGDYRRGRALNEESLMLFDQTGDRWTKASPLSNLGWIAYSQGDCASARKLCEESLELFQEVGDTNGCALVTNLLGEIARVTGDYVEAAAKYEQSIALTPIGADVALASKRSGLASKGANLGFAVLHQHDDIQAHALFRESMLTARKSDDKYTMALCLNGFAGVALARLETRHAGRLLAASLALLDSSGVQLEHADRIQYESTLAAVREVMDGETFEKASAEGRAMTLQQAIECANETAA